MPQTYVIELPAGKDPGELLARAKAEGKSKGIALVGDIHTGTFKGTADGSYVMEDGKITVTVDRKPGFVPWGVVESALKGLFAAR